MGFISWSIGSAKYWIRNPVLSSNGQGILALAGVVLRIARVMFFFSWSDEVRATCVPLSFHLEYSEDGYDLSFGLLLIGDGGG